MSAVQPQAVPAMTVASGNRNAKNIPVGPEGREWSYGLFDCFATPGTYLVSCFCPCITYGKIKRRYEHLNSTGTPDTDQGEIFNSDCMLNGCLHLTCRASVILEFMLRRTIKERYNIKGGAVQDCCIAYWCTPCELTQESREIELEENIQVYGPGAH